jgi:hypothetical protein
MSRLFWVALGATTGAMVVHKVTRTAAAYTPAGLGRGIRELGDSVRYFAEEVRAGMTEREDELREALGLEPGPPMLALPEATPDSTRRSLAGR